MQQRDNDPHKQIAPMVRNKLVPVHDVIMEADRWRWDASTGHATCELTAEELSDAQHGMRSALDLLGPAPETVDELKERQRLLVEELKGVEQRIREAEGVHRVEIYARNRRLNAKGNGEESFRLLEHDGKLVFADAHPDAVVVSNSWTHDRASNRAADRRCSKVVEVPVGLLLVEIEKPVSGYRGKPARYAAGVTTRKEDGGPILWEWMDGATVRHRGIVRGRAGLPTHEVERHGKRERWSSG